MTFRLVFLFNACMLLSFYAIAQDRCGTVEYNKQLKRRGLIPSDDRVFEDWLKSKMTTLRASSSKRLKGPPYKIPVVVHVIHKGEAVGTGSNIPEAQILSQIAVLNEDFRRLNPDAVNTPSQFLPVAGSLDIEFVLAKRDPEGLPTNGIVRVQGSKDGWVLADQYELKAQSYWPAEDYLNLWVCDMVDNLVGYGQYPESNLPGIDNSSTNRLTDGVAVWYRAFGSLDDGNFDLSSNFNKGRTLTHELGHFLGLRHIWGDDSGACTGTDYVEDTPNQATSSSGCPTHPRNSCGTVNMFQNFMDYTQDACMNLFTKNQMDRVTTVLENSPRRASLLNSPGLSDPLAAERDLGLRSVISPTGFECSSTIIPSVEIRNYGTATISSAKIQLSLNAIVVETISINTTLANLEAAQIDFAPVVATSGNNEIEFLITEVNGSSDQNPDNNTFTRTFRIAERESAPFAETFSAFPGKWSIVNPDGKITWDAVTAPRETSTNKAARINFFDYEESYGELDALVSPVFDLTSAPVASLIFDRSYVRYLSSNDRLKVVILRDCQPLDEGTVVLDLTGTALRTANSVAGSFVPAGTQDWQREFVDISAFAGEPNIQIAFIAISDWGNNLYLDNISVITSELEDVALIDIESPSFITCETNPSPTVIGQNIGTKTILSLTIQYTVNGVTDELIFSGLNIQQGDAFQLQLPSIPLSGASNTVAITLLNPNGQNDQSPANNSKSFILLLDQSTDKIPTRQNFDLGLENWTAFTASGGTTWQSTSTNFDRSVYYAAHSNTSANDVAWLVSPVLDFSGAATASLVFDHSYRQRPGKRETLKVYGSKDCGSTFEEISSVGLQTEEQEAGWAPTMAAHWVQNAVVNLNEYAGESNVRIAFAVVNNNGNNLFLDNLEFFTTDDPVLIDLSDIYNIYGYNAASPSQSRLQLSFNLPERNEVEYMIVDMMGKTLGHANLADVLNQTYELDADRQLTAGTYILRLRIGQQTFVDRFVIMR